MSIDTLSYYEKLVNAGETPEAAKAHVYALDGMFSNVATKDDLKNFATKDDLNELRIEFKSDITALAASTKQDMMSFKNEINSKIDTIRTLGWAMFGAILIPLIKIAFWG